MEEPAALDVRRAEELAHVPAALALVVDLVLANVYVWSGKWPQKMIAFDQKLRTTLAVTSAHTVVR